MRRALASLLLLACSSVPTPTPAPARRSAPAPAPASPPVPLAMTIDDLPWVGPTRPGDSRARGAARILEAAARRDAPIAGFFTCAGFARGPEALRRWLEAPITLGNHSTSHRALDELGFEAWREDVTACQRELERRASRPVPYFRYPFLRTGRERALRDRGLAYLDELGVERAPVSVDTSEWALVRPYVHALERGDEARAREIADAYVAHVRRAARRFVGLASARGHGGAPQILLLHANALAADHLGRLLEGLRRDGFAFIALEEALAHPLYAEPDRYSGGTGLSWLYRVEPEGGAAWAWDAAQLHAFEVRFDGETERAAFDLDAELAIRRVAEQSWVVTHAEPWPASSLVARMADGTILFVDTPYTVEATRALLDWVDARFGPGPRVAINTHFHPDAVGGNRALLDAGVQVHASDHTARLTRRRRDAMRARLSEQLADRPAIAARFAGYAPASAPRTFEERAGLELDLGEPVRVLYPGAAHSPDNVVVWLPRRGLLFAGCMVTGRSTLGSTSDADLSGWPGALDRIEALSPRIVVPGHGEGTAPALIERTRALVEAASGS